jgi:HPt (histidine-containing phosphotransfer) domain-containing protein
MLRANPSQSMSQKVRAEFMTVFVTTARRRVVRGLELAAAGEVEGLHRELHSLAGDAGLLSVTRILDAAREGEAAAKRWLEAARVEEDSRASCVRSLEGIARLLDEMTAGGSGQAP